MGPEPRLDNRRIEAMLRSGSGGARLLLNEGRVADGAAPV